MLLQMSAERFNQLRGIGEQEYTMNSLTEEQREKERLVKEKIREIPQEKRTEKLEQKAQELIESANVTKRDIDGITVSTYDLMFILADSLQRLYSGENKTTEYHDWVQIEDKIEIDLNTNGVEQHELDAKHGFIGFLDQRETELKLVISLYSAAALYGNDYYKERARDELKFLTFKLSELRRLRTKMQATPDKTDAQERTERELINRGQAYLLYKTGVLADEFENDPAHQFLRIRPQTSNVAESEARINYLRARDEARTRKLVEGYRMGKSREDIEKEELAASENYHERFSLREKINRIKGFTMAHFMDTNTNGRASA